MGQIVDTHVHIYEETEPAWISPPLPAPRLIEYMDRSYLVAGEQRRIDRALVMPMPGATIIPHSTFREQHELMVQDCRRYPDRLVATSSSIRTSAWRPASPRWGRWSRKRAGGA